MNIIKGVVSEPQKVVIYGPQGIGKSSLAALFPSPLFLDTERGSRRLAVDRLEIESLPAFTAAVQAAAKQGDFKEYQTIVIDTIDWLEAKVKEKVVAQYSAKDRSYDREGSFIGDEMMKVLSSLDTLTQAGRHVVLLAHSATVKIDLPDQQASFDRYELDMNKKHVAPIVKHWADHLLFLRYKLRVREVDEGKNKGLGGEERLICLSTCASYDAKVRGKEPLSGEHSCKSPEEGIAVVRRIFTNASAPWGKPVAGAETVTKEVQKPASEPVAEKPAEEKTVIEQARERGNKTNWPKEGKPAGAIGQTAHTYTGTNWPAMPATDGRVINVHTTPAVQDTTPDDDEIPGLPPLPAGESQQSTGAHPLEVICAPHEAAVNAFLVTRREIQQGQTFRDVRPAYAERVLKNPVLFMEQATKGGSVS